MTNEELIRRFFRGKVWGDEESYGFSVKPLLRKSVGNFALFSKTSQFPMTVRPSEYYYVISVPFIGYYVEGSGTNWKNHLALITEIAKQLGIKFVSSPRADRAYFHDYMETKINYDLLALANDLRTGSYHSVLRSTEVDPWEPKYALASESESYFAVPENYQKLMESIDALLEGERILGLPKNQVALLDTDGTQSLWRWLIKESPIKEERELLREMYMLSRLLAPKETKEEHELGGYGILFPTPK